MRTRLVMLLATVLLTAACGGDPDPFGVGSTTSEGGTSSSTAPDRPTTTPPTTAAPTTAMPPAPLLEQIASSGVFRVGVFAEPFLPFADPALGTGFEPDLAREIAARLFGEIDVEFVPIAAADRFTALADGTIDILIRGTAHTTSRAELANFSAPYLLDGVVAVVGGDTGWSSVEDLAGSSLAVMAGTTLELEGRDRLHAAGVEVDLVTVTEYPAVPFMAGAVDGYLDGWLSAVSALLADPGLRIIWLGPTDPIAAAMPRGDRAYVTAVTTAVREIVEDGTWNQLAETWFPGRVPWTNREMLRRPPSDR